MSILFQWIDFSFADRSAIFFPNAIFVKRVDSSYQTTQSIINQFTESIESIQTDFTNLVDHRPPEELPESSKNDDIMY